MPQRLTSGPQPRLALPRRRDRREDSGLVLASHASTAGARQAASGCPSGSETGAAVGRAGVGPVPGQEIVHPPVPEAVADGPVGAGPVGAGPVADPPWAAAGAVGPSANLAVRAAAPPGWSFSRTSPVHLIPSHHRSTVGEPGAGYQPGGCEP